MTNLSTLPGFGAASSGGGGGSSSDSVKPTTLYASDQVGTWESGWDEHTTYARVHQYSPRGQFAIHSHTFSSGAQGGPNYASNRLRIAPFTVDQSTGAMTFGTKANAFINTSGYVHSTMSFGFAGTYGVNWGHSAWGSGNTHYNGGCVWRVVNNAVVGGQSSGNANYASDYTSNGNLAVYEHGGIAYYNIPNAQYTSLGSISTAGVNNDWATASETNHGSGNTYIYRCVGNQVGENHAGLMSHGPGIVAMNAQGSGTTVGSTFSDGALQTQSGGIGFELDSGAQVFFTVKGCYIRGSKTGGITYKATVSNYAGSASIPNIATGGTDLGMVGIATGAMTYETGGYPAKEADTFYFYSGTGTQELIKFKIRMPSASTVTLERLGAVDLREIAGTGNMGHYHALVDVTGNDDQFIVASFRANYYAPSYTIVVDNPIKDA